jgi:ribonuclease VapC
VTPSNEPVVLDASALLSLLQGEPRADEVEGALDGALMSSVSLSEVLQKAEQHGVETEGLEYDLEALGLEFRSFDLPMARPTAELWSAGGGLSFGDRTCLALALATRSTVLTTDAAMAAGRPEAGVRLIR